MFTLGSKYFLTFAFVAWLGALAYGMSTGGDLVGVLSSGYKGGVGDHLGYMLLQTLFFSFTMLGVVAIISRDGDGDGEVLAATGSAQQPALPAGAASGNTGFWGPLLGVGVAFLIVGVSLSPAFLIVAAGIVVMVVFEWTVLTWSDRSTTDPTVNEVLRDRLIAPMEIPLMGLVAIAFVVLGVSRVLLASSEIGAVVIVAAMASIVFAGAIALVKRAASRGVINLVVAIGTVTILAGAVVGAVRGERNFEHHEGEIHSEE